VDLALGHRISHFQGLEIMIRHLGSNLSDQRISERYDILFGNLGHQIIRALPEKLQKLRKTAAIKNHRKMEQSPPSR
jgi:hypothetical protein